MLSQTGLSPAWSQEDSGKSKKQADSDAADDETLEPVIVDPDAETAPPSTEPSTSQPTPFDDDSFDRSTSEPSTAGVYEDYFNLPDAYPALGDQVIGGSDGTGLDSALRGERSLYDMMSFGTIVNRNRIEEKQASDMFRALQNEVGVLMQQTARGQASPFVRGLTGQQVLILVDGIRMNNAIFRAGPNQYFNLIDPGQVEAIEVIRGPQSVLWGSDAIGGVINVVTRSANPLLGNNSRSVFNQIVSTADWGSYTRANVEGSVGNAGIFGGASYFNVNNLDTAGPLGRQPFTYYDQNAGDIKYNSLIGDDQMLTVAFQHFVQEDLPRSDRFLPFVLGPPANQPRPTFFDPQQRDLAYVRLQGLGDNLFFDAYTSTFSYARNKEGTRTVRSATQTDLAEFDDDTLGGNLVFARDFDWLGVLTYGADYYHDNLDTFRRRINPNTGVSVPQNPQFPSDSLYDRMGTFVSWYAPLTGNLDLISGLRYENANAHGTLNELSAQRTTFDRTYQDWIGSIGLGYEVANGMRIVGNVSEGYRAPNLDDLTADNPILQNAQQLPTLDVQPEHATTYEIGMLVDTPIFRGQIFEFWTDLQDAIQSQAVNNLGQPVPDIIGPNGTLIPGSANFIRVNSDAYINGTEMAGEVMLAGGWSTYGNFWYTYGQDVGRDRPFSRIPPTQGIWGLRWRDNDSPFFCETYSWLVRRQDRYATINNIDSRFPVGGTPGYGTLNFRAGTFLGARQQHRLTLGLENITDKAYRVLGSGVDGAGFNAIVGWYYGY